MTSIHVVKQHPREFTKPLDQVNNNYFIFRDRQDWHICRENLLVPLTKEEFETKCKGLHVAKNLTFTRGLSGVGVISLSTSRRASPHRRIETCSVPGPGDPLKLERGDRFPNSCERRAHSFVLCSKNPQLNRSKVSKGFNSERMQLETLNLRPACPPKRHA